VKPRYWERAKRELFRSDPRLGAIIARHPRIHLVSRGDSFQTLARSIVGQQISVKAAQAVWLRLDDELIGRAKRHSARSGKSVSKLVSDYFALIDDEPSATAVTPRVRSLRGALAGSGLDEGDYRRHLEDKHR